MEVLLAILLIGMFVVISLVSKVDLVKLDQDINKVEKELQWKEVICGLYWMVNLKKYISKRTKEKHLKS